MSRSPVNRGRYALHARLAWPVSEDLDGMAPSYAIPEFIKVEKVALLGGGPELTLEDLPEHVAAWMDERQVLPLDSKDGQARSWLSRWWGAWQRKKQLSSEYIRCI